MHSSANTFERLTDCGLRGKVRGAVSRRYFESSITMDVSSSCNHAPVSLRRAIALVCEQTQMHSYHLVYWPEEVCVSTVRSDRIISPSLEDLKVGAECKVSIGRKVFEGKVAATGSKVEMEQLEEDFVSGTWSLPFSDNVEPSDDCNPEPPSKRQRKKTAATKAPKKGTTAAKATKKGTTAAKATKKGTTAAKAAKKGKENVQPQSKSCGRKKPGEKGAIIQVSQHGGNAPEPGSADQGSDSPAPTETGETPTTQSPPSSCIPPTPSSPPPASHRPPPPPTPASHRPPPLPTPASHRPPPLSLPSNPPPLASNPLRIPPPPVPVSRPHPPASTPPHPPAVSNDGSMLSDSDPLYLEMEVQYLRDKVEEYGRNQENILIRMGALEDVVRDLQNNSDNQPTIRSPPQHRSHFTQRRFSPEFSPEPSPGPQWSPTPSPLPSPLPSPPRNRFPLREWSGNYQASGGMHYPHSSQYWYGQDSSAVYSGFPPMQYSPSGSYPFPPPLPQSHQSTATPTGVPRPQITGQPPRCEPLKHKPKVNKMSSSRIDKDKLTDPHNVVEKYSNYKSISRAPTLAQKLAEEAYFGKHVLQACTVMGFRQYPALPVRELTDLKQMLFSLFPQLWNNPTEFEPVWAACTEAIGQKCKRLRGNV